MESKLGSDSSNFFPTGCLRQPRVAARHMAAGRLRWIERSRDERSGGDVGSPRQCADVLCCNSIELGGLGRKLIGFTSKMWLILEMEKDEKMFNKIYPYVSEMCLNLCLNVFNLNPYVFFP